MDYNFDGKDIERVRAKLGKLKFTEVAQEGLARALIVGQNFMIDVTPVGVTGNLSQSWHTFINGLKGTLANRKKY